MGGAKFGRIGHCHRNFGVLPPHHLLIDHIGPHFQIQYCVCVTGNHLTEVPIFHTKIVLVGASLHPYHNSLAVPICLIIITIIGQARLRLEFNDVNVLLKLPH